MDSNGDGLGLAYSGALVPRRRDPISVRLHYLYTQLSEVIQQWRPSEVAIEEPFIGRNVRSSVAIGQAQAVALVAAAHYGLPVSNYAPRRVKQAVTDYGDSSKEQVEEMVKALLGVDDIPGSPDASDALAVAICHINTSVLRGLVIRN